jgi:uncharacterized glyoxalase superfamily protein PhnB
MSTDSPKPTPATERVQPESFRARDVAVSLTVKDVEASLVWYRDVLRFTVDRRHERGGSLRAVSLKAGVARFLIVQDNGEKGLDRVKGQGFSLQLTTAQSVDEIAARVKAHGIALETEPETAPWGVRLFRVKDPDGFTLVIASERPDSTEA